MYVPEAQAQTMRDVLVNRADLATPNPFELGWLTGTGMPTSVQQMRIAAEKLAVPSVLATSAPAMMRGHIANLLVQNEPAQKSAHLAEHRSAIGPPNGMGDLAAALMLGNLLNRCDPVSSLNLNVN